MWSWKAPTFADYLVVADPAARRQAAVGRPGSYHDTYLWCRICFIFLKTHLPRTNKYTNIYNFPKNP